MAKQDDYQNNVDSDIVEETADSAEVKAEEPINEYKSKYLRALADYQNLEKQTQTWKEDFVQYANVGLIRKLLEVLDDLEKAQEHVKDEGLQLVINKLRNILAAEGLEEIKILGQEYDPNKAEVVSTEKGDKDNVITKVLQKGYTLKDKTVRVAKVIVSIKQN